MILQQVTQSLQGRKNQPGTMSRSVVVENEIVAEYKLIKGEPKPTVQRKQGRMVEDITKYSKLVLLMLQ